MPTENEIIVAMQRDVAYAKKVIARIAANAGKLVTINHKDGRNEAAADAMAWHSASLRLHADLLSGHSEASKALEKHYGGEIIAAGPVR